MQPSSSEITVPARIASAHAAIRRASNGLTRPATSSGSTKAYPANSPSCSVIAATSPGARLEMRVLLNAVLDRLPGLRLDPAAEDPHIHGLLFRSPPNPPVRFDPA